MKIKDSIAKGVIFIIALWAIIMVSLLNQRSDGPWTMSLFICLVGLVDLVFALIWPALFIRAIKSRYSREGVLLCLSAAVSCGFVFNNWQSWVEGAQPTVFALLPATFIFGVTALLAESIENIAARISMTVMKRKESDSQGSIEQPINDSLLIVFGFVLIAFTCCLIVDWVAWTFKAVGGLCILSGIVSVLRKRFRGRGNKDQEWE